MEDTLLRELLAFATERKVAKNEFIISEGHIDQNIYYVKSGAVRVLLQTEFEELTIRFGYQDSFITSLTSFIKGTPSEFYVQAIRATTLYVVPKVKFMELVATDEKYLKLYAAILEGLVIQQMEREIDLLTPSPAERLKRVMERSPRVFQEIPSKYIASYLRMTPETLSRIRKADS